MFLRSRTYPHSSSSLPLLLLSLLWQHFVVLMTELFLTHGKALDPSLGYSAIEIVGEV